MFDRPWKNRIIPGILVCADGSFPAENIAALASLQALRARSNANGFIGNLEYGALTD